MNFAELRFWGLLLLGVAVIVCLRPCVPAAAWPRYDRVMLAALGMFLLLCVSALTFVIWLAVALASYFGLQWILARDPQASRKYLLVLIPLQLAPLLAYKYADFVLNRSLGLDFDTLRDLVIPVGLSFYTFQMIGFVVDTLGSRQPLPRFLDFLNFTGFFPQIVAGPIERRRDLLPQMEAFGLRWNRDAINDGASWVVVGLFFKCGLADNLARWLPVFLDTTASPFMIWVSNLLFGLRIYYDFAGYSLVACGLALCFGVRLTLNFRSPYAATNIQEFWRRWHVTLSNWFRDYVYVPLGGGRASRWAGNVTVVFVVAGLWHGAGWNFVLWGAWHGLLLIGYRLSRKLACPAPVGWGITMVGAFLAWLCFYETRPEFLWRKLGSVLSPAAYTADAFRGMVGTLTAGEWTVVGSLLGLTAGTLVLEGLSVRRQDPPYALLRRPAVLAVLVVLTVLLAPEKHNAFVYFAF